MYEQIREDTLYIMFYAVVITLAILASCYLLLRDGNAFAAEITPPLRLRRWAAAFFASIALNHAWYMPVFFLDSSKDIEMTDLVGGLLDGMTFFPLAIIVLLAMLQDRRRPLWPAFAMMVPFVAGGGWGVVTHSYALLPMVYAYALLLCVAIIIYMVRATRQYGRWLRDNYADLEHKEVWQSFLVLAFILLAFCIYAVTSEGPAYQYAMQIILMIMICYLLWRVETLSDLSIHLDPVEETIVSCLPPAKADHGESRSSAGEYHSPDDEYHSPAGEYHSPDDECQSSNGITQVTQDNIRQLLQQYCIDTQLYLQHDLTIHQLAKAIGTNRFYLSQYFSGQGITYNAYINDLRIERFMTLYREAIATQRSFTAHQLAHESGYRSYSTFGLAFKQRMGQTVTAWMRETAN